MDKEFLSTLVLAIIGSGIFSGSLAAIVNAVHDRKKKESAEDEAKTKAIMFLLASSIRTECQNNINAGEIDAEDLSRLEQAWKIYHDGLHGNGFLDTFMSDIRRLPKKKTA